MVIQPNAKLTEAHFGEAKESAYFLLDLLPNSIIYHRKQHTIDSVVPEAIKIAIQEGFPLEKQMLVGIAAAFHDTGFLVRYNANEPVGAFLAELHMRESQHAFTEDHVAIVKDAIGNTNMKNPPQTEYARVLRDADLAIIGHPDFIQRNADLREECKLHPESPMHQASLDESRWAQSQLGFISQFHRWFTIGARSLYEIGKQRNVIAFKTYYHLDQN